MTADAAPTGCDGTDAKSIAVRALSGTFDDSGPAVPSEARSPSAPANYAAWKAKAVAALESPSTVRPGDNGFGHVVHG